VTSAQLTPAGRAGVPDGVANRLNVLQVGLEVVPQSGGTTTAITRFQEALGGSIVSFTRPSFLPSQPTPGILHLPTASTLLGRSYGWSGEAHTRPAAALLSDADLIIIHGLLRYHSQWAAEVARRLRIPYWVVPHGGLDPYVFTYRALRKRLWMELVGQRLLRGAAACVFATSREHAKAEARLPSGKHEVIHWPVGGAEAEDAAWRSQERLRLRERLRVGPGARLLLFLGRLHPSKGVLETIRLVHEAAATDTHLLVAGPDSDVLTRADCARLVAELGAANVYLLGPVFGAEKRTLLLGSDGFVSLSHKENFGFAVAEAVVSGLPVIVSPEIDLASELQPLDCGWTLNTLAREECLAALRAFASAPDEELRAMGERGRRWARPALSGERFVARLAALAGDTAQPRARGAAAMSL
jgi:glycosyltransferase involved in cell wall biosynthesis